MCNCGNKRTALTVEQPANAGIISSAESNTTNSKNQIRFEYIGKTALTVTGSITGKRYRFSVPGEFLQVDVRDASVLMSIPVLRKALEI